MTHPASRRTYFFVYFALLVLLVLTITADQFELGVFNTVIAVGIAGMKMTLIMLFFMHLRGSSRAVQIVALAGLFWLAILFGLTMADFVSRGWVGAF